MVELSEAYVLGLLADLEPRAPELVQELQQAKKRAGAVDAELSNLLRRLDAAKQALADARSQADRSSLEITERNQRIASLHQEIGTLRKRSEDFKLEMERVEGALRRRLRRERAKLTVQIEDREEEIEQLRSVVESERETLQTSEEAITTERDRSRALTAELDKLQSQLPDPYLYARIFETLAARAHCNLYLDGSETVWKKELTVAIAYVQELHRELRAGKYRLDKNSELIGGRAMASAEAIYGAVALGNDKLARELFELATDPGLFFHQIFNVFRVWCLGLYLSGRHRELRELLRLHQYAPGLRGGYVQAFIGLVGGDARRVALGLKDITKHEWELWQDPQLVRGAGVVNLGAVALGRLALARGIAVQVPGPTVPDGLIAGPSRALSKAHRSA